MGSMPHLVSVREMSAWWSMNESGLTMSAKYEITRKYAAQYAKASKKTKGELLDKIIAVTGWSRDNARRRLTRAGKAPRPRKEKHGDQRVNARVGIPMTHARSCRRSGLSLADSAASI